MTIEDNKALVQRFIDEVMNAGNTAAIVHFCVPGSMFAGGIEGQFRAMQTAFPDIHFTNADIVAEGNKVVIRMTIHATNTGPLVGLPAFGKFEKPIPPTGQSITGSGIYIFTVSDGKLVSFAVELDQIALLRQLGWIFSPPNQT